MAANAAEAEIGVKVPVHDPDAVAEAEVETDEEAVELDAAVLTFVDNVVATLPGVLELEATLAVPAMHWE